MKEKEEENKDHQSEMPNFKGMFEGATLTNCTQNFIWGNETVHVHSDVKQKGETGNENADNKEISKDQLAHAVENCQEYFWANSSYAVLFCMASRTFLKATGTFARTRSAISAGTPP